MILVADGSDDAAPVADSMIMRGIELPLYNDATQCLRNDYTVMANKAYFSLDSNGIVMEFGTLDLGAKEFAQLVRY